MATSPKDSSDQLKDMTISSTQVRTTGKSVGREIGRGAYGRVFTVKYCEVICAAKEIHSLLVEGVGQQQEHHVKEGFLRECQHCSVLNHPNIVRFIGIYYPKKDSTIPVMIMELMDESLYDYMKNLPKNAWTKKGSILIDVAEGLIYLHAQKPAVVHRDLSPKNILLKVGKHEVLAAKIGDLGVAKIIKADSRVTQSVLTKVPGTADFMPPETFGDRPVYGTPLDVFSYGGIVLFVATHQWPTPTIQVELDPVSKKLVAHTEVERRQKYLDEMRGDAEWLKPLVESCLSNDPSERPTMSAVSKHLKGSSLHNTFVVVNTKDVQELTQYLKQNPSRKEEYTETWINRVFDYPLQKTFTLGDDTLNCSSPFVVAAQYGYTKVVKLFLQKFSGALDVNHTATIVSLNTQNVVQGATALWCACTGNYVEIVKMLIEAGADMNKPTITGSTPLRGAAFNGHCSVMEVLITNGADLDYANVVGQSPLLIAVMQGHLRATEMLLDKGADHKHRTIHHHSIIHLAAGKGHLEILQMLLDRGISPQFYLDHDHEHFKECACPVVLAASTGKTEAVEMLCALKECPPECESEAYLLLGATMAETNRRIFNGEVKEYWIKALQIREKCGYKPKFLPPFKAYGNVEELQSIEDLERVFPNPFETEKWFSYQSLIIRERIMGHSDTGLIYYLVRRGIIYCRLNQYDLAELIWLKALKSMYRYSDKIATLGSGLVDGIQKDVNRDLMFIVDGVYAMTEDYQHEPAFSEFLEYILHHLDDVNKYSTKDENDYKVSLQLMLYLIYCWLRYDTYMMKDKAQDTITWSEKCDEFGRRIVKTYLHSPKDSTLLHMAVSDFGIGGKSTFYTAVSKDTVDQLSLLLKALLYWGADDALYDMDDTGNRPIHIAVQTSQIKTSPNLAILLVKHGCSPYVVNTAGEDALSLASTKIKEEIISAYHCVAK